MTTATNYTDDTSRVTLQDIEAVKLLIGHLRSVQPEHRNTALFCEIQDQIEENEALLYVLETRLRSQH